MSHNPEGISMDLYGNLDYDDPDTCEFGRYDEAGNTIEECQRTDYEEVAMFDGGVVRLCPTHRSWGPSLGRSEKQVKPNE